jgi:hypothetical protein
MVIFAVKGDTVLPAPTSTTQTSLFDFIASIDKLRVSSPGELDVSFLLRTFCNAGLPMTRPRDEMAAFHRFDGQIALTVSPQEIALPRGTICRIGVPYGAQARLLMLWAATEARDVHRASDDQWLEIGRIKPWLSSIGIKTHSDNVSKTKDQLIRISFVHFTIIMGGAGESTLFRNEPLVDGGILGEGDLEHYAAGRLNHIRWPSGLRISRSALDHFRNDAIPIPTSRLPLVAHSAMALDVFTYLCYRLPMIPQGEAMLVGWRELIKQFGNGEAVSKFRQTFQASINAAVRAYPEANMALTEEGLRLHYSDPAVLRQPFIALPKKAVENTAPKGPRKLGKRRTAVT